MKMQLSLPLLSFFAFTNQIGIVKALSEDDLEFVGMGFCVDASENMHDQADFWLNSPEETATEETCIADDKCGFFTDGLVGVTIDMVHNACTCWFDDNAISDSMEQAFKDIGADVYTGAIGSGPIVQIHSAMPWPGMECYRYNPALPTTTASAQGDPTIIGLRGQVFKFDGRNGGWYSNIASESFKWNMEFQKFDTCPSMEDTFVSSSSFHLFDSVQKKWTKILIKTTPLQEDDHLKLCEQSGAACLGEGTIQISFDGGETFHSNAGDYHIGTESRVIAHNTYAACSRKWYDYEVSNTITSNTKNNLRSNDGGRRLAVKEEKSPYQYLSDKTAFMIEPVECGVWLQDRVAKNDLFEQRGMWSTIHVETPLVSFHVEYRRSNPNKVDRNCDFQSLDTWMTRVSPELNDQEWNGILGETRKPTFDLVSGEEIKSDRFQILRGKDDADYEVEGPFGMTFNAAVRNTNDHQLHDIVAGVVESLTEKIL